MPVSTWAGHSATTPPVANSGRNFGGTPQRPGHLRDAAPMIPEAEAFVRHNAHDCLGSFSSLHISSCGASFFSSCESPVEARSRWTPSRVRVLSPKGYGDNSSGAHAHGGSHPKVRSRHAPPTGNCRAAVSGVDSAWLGCLLGGACARRGTPFLPTASLLSLPSTSDPCCAGSSSPRTLSPHLSCPLPCCVSALWGRRSLRAGPKDSFNKGSMSDTCRMRHHPAHSAGRVFCFQSSAPSRKYPKIWDLPCMQKLRKKSREHRTHVDVCLGPAA